MYQKSQSCMVPEIQCETGKISCHFGSYFAFLTPPPLSPTLMIPKVKILKKKMKKWKQCLKILSFYRYMCTINEDQMIYGSWNIRSNRQKFLSFWAILCPFSPPDNLENQNFNIEKNTLRYYHFTHLHHKWQSYDAWFLKYEAWQT